MSAAARSGSGIEVLLLRFGITVESNNDDHRRLESRKNGSIFLVESNVGYQMWERRGLMEWTEEWRVGWLAGWGVSPGWMEKVPIIGLLLKEISPFAKRGIGGVTRRFLLLFLVFC